MGEVALAAGGSGEPRTGLGDVTVVARSRRTGFSASTGRVVSPRRPAARPGAAVGRAVSADGRDHDRVERLLGAGVTAQQSAPGRAVERRGGTAVPDELENRALPVRADLV